jgi:hypothetical protein
MGAKFSYIGMNEDNLGEMKFVNEMQIKIT